MVIKKVLIFTIIFYIISLLQTSFLVHFNVFLGWGGFLPILIIVILVNLFAPRHEWWGVITAISGGFFLDIFSGASDHHLHFIGYWILILVLVAFFIKFVLRKYVNV